MPSNHKRWMPRKPVHYIPRKRVCCMPRKQVHYMQRTRTDYMPRTRVHCEAYTLYPDGKKCEWIKMYIIMAHENIHSKGCMLHRQMHKVHKWCCRSLLSMWKNWHQNRHCWQEICYRPERLGSAGVSVHFLAVITFMDRVVSSRINLLCFRQLIETIRFDCLCLK